MSIILVLIPLSIVFAVAFLAAFIWAVRSGQYEDTCTPSMRLLLDESGGTKIGPPPPQPPDGGVRPSPGAETSEFYTPREHSIATVASHISAPGDGRTPPGPERGRADSHFLQSTSNQQ